MQTTTQIQQQKELLNNRYQRVKRLGEGSYGTVYLAIDTKPTGIKRKADPKALSLLERVDQAHAATSESGSMAGKGEGDVEMRDEALQVLGNRSMVFQQNEAFTGQQQQEEAQDVKYVALKKVKQNDFNDRNGIPFSALREIKLLQETSHENIIQLYDVFYIQKTIFLVLEYTPFDLGHSIIRDGNKPSTIVLKDEHVKNIMKQVLEGLNYLHSTHYLMHRDLTPSNIMLTADGQVKLIDFGLTKSYGTPERQHTKNVTTRFYRAPEILFGAVHYGPAIDMWGVGCIMTELILKEVLFPGSSDIDQLGKIFTIRGVPNQEDWPGVEELPCYLEFTIKEQKPLSSILSFVSPACLDLLERLLQLNPRKRITASDALQHPYFTEELPKPCANSDLPLPKPKHI